MGKYIICLLISAILGIGSGFADIEHTVARGESIESIAEKYGITPEQVLEANKDASTLFYIGQKLKIPNARVNSENTSVYSHTNNQNSLISSMERGLVDDAKRHFEHKEWGKAVKTYSKLIKDYPKSIYYYNRALSYFNNNKNRQAANDFEKALSMEDCTSSIRKNGSKLLAEAQRRHREWKNKQANLIGGAILGVAAMGLTTWAAIESSKIESSNKEYYSQEENYSSSSSSYNASSDNNNEESSSIGSTYTSGSSQRRCVFCNGTGKVRKSISTPTFGLPQTKKKCEDCGEYYYPSSGHAHIF